MQAQPKNPAKWIVEDHKITAAFVEAAAPVGVSLKHFGGRSAVRATRHGRNHFALQAEDETTAAQVVDELPEIIVPAGEMQIRFSLRLIGRRVNKEGHMEFFDPEDPDTPLGKRAGPNIVGPNTQTRILLARQSRGLPIKIYPNKSGLGSTADITAATLTLFIGRLGFHAHYPHELLVRL